MSTTPQQPSSPSTEQPGQSPSPQPGHRFGALAWAALILGIVGVVGSPIIFLNNLTAVIAVVGVVLGVIALFGTRKVLAGAGVVVCVAAISFTVMAQGAAVEEFDQAFTDPAAADGAPPAIEDVTVSECAVVDDGFGPSAEAVIGITNSTSEIQSYWVTVSVNDENGDRVGEISAVSNSLAAGQSVTLSGIDASGLVSQTAQPGPAQCTVADVDRFSS